MRRDRIDCRSPRNPGVTKAQMARALSAAGEAWGDEARVTIHPDRTITIERGPARDPDRPQVAPTRDFIP
jgi:hypothetical protein